MNKKVYFSMLFFLLLAIACKPVIKTQQPEIQENIAVNSNVEEVEEDLSDFEDLNEELSIEDLDSLDKDLEDLETLNIE